MLPLTDAMDYLSQFPNLVAIGPGDEIIWNREGMNIIRGKDHLLLTRERKISYYHGDPLIAKFNKRNHCHVAADPDKKQNMNTINTFMGKNLRVYADPQ